MKVIVAVNEKDQIAAHAGQCERFFVYNVDKKEIVGQQEVSLAGNKSAGCGCHGQSHGQGHQHDQHHHRRQEPHICGGGTPMVEELSDCQALLCRSAGAGFIRKHQLRGCQVLLVKERDPQKAVLAWANGEILVQEESPCSGH